VLWADGKAHADPEPAAEQEGAALPRTTTAEAEDAAYGAHSDQLTARALFTCLQLPPEELPEQVRAGTHHPNKNRCSG
jgi:hypothetical protein